MMVLMVVACCVLHLRHSLGPNRLATSWVNFKEAALVRSSMLRNSRKLVSFMSFICASVHSSYFALTQRENLILQNHMPAKEPPWLVHCHPLKPQLQNCTGHVRAFGAFSAFGAANPVAKNWCGKKRCKNDSTEESLQLSPVQHPKVVRTIHSLAEIATYKSLKSRCAHGTCICQILKPS